MRRCILAMTVGATLSVCLAIPAKAQDAEFGCKVLLCAAANNPSWPSISYCVPVMNQLFSMMRSLRFRWPVCSAAGTGAPGYEPYQPCPAGWRETGSTNTGGESGVSSYLGDGSNDLCARRLQPDPTGRPLQASMPGGQIHCSASDGDDRGGTGSSQTCVEYIPRPRNERPYYFDVRGADGSQNRVWFNTR